MTLDRRTSRELERPVETRDQLIDYLRGGEKRPADWRVGIEHEKLGLRRAGLTPIPYEGSDGIEALLRYIAAEDPSWTPVYEDDHVVALDGSAGGITLEPGAQVELNGRPLVAIQDTCAEFHAHLDLLRKCADAFGYVWLGLGVHPIHKVSELPRVPRERYNIMRRYLPTRGRDALAMMHATASVQVSLDFASEADLIDKLRTALGVTPIVAALYANSAISEGAPNGFVSRRIEIWRHTDPDRTGLLPIAFDEGFGYERYVDWALDVPMFFVVRDGRYRAMNGKTFRRFLAEGHDGERATLADFERHLTTLFPEARVKRIVEVRCADAVPPELLCTIPALWKGLLYSEDARGAARELTRAWSADDRDAAFAAVARCGLAAETPGGTALDLARELERIARRGLSQIGNDEARFLDPLGELLERGRSPGEEVLERWHSDWKGSIQRLIDFAAY